MKPKQTIKDLLRTTAVGAGGYKIVNRGATGEIFLYGIVGDDWFEDGVTAGRVKDDLRSMKSATQIDVRINSEGGDVFEGNTIYTLLRDHGAKIVVHVDGLAASVASVIAMAGDEIHIAEAGFMMLHNAWGIAMGEAADMRKTADLLESVSASIVGIYAARTGIDALEIQDMMNGETWFNAEEAIEAGFATDLVPNLQVAALVNFPSRFEHMPSVLTEKRIAKNAAMERINATVSLLNAD